MDEYDKIFNEKYFKALNSIENQDSKSLKGFHRKDNPYLSEFKKYLQFAEGKEPSALTKEKRGKLKAIDWDYFVQTRNELLIAYFIDKYLGCDVEFEPPSYQGKRGDLEINCDDGKKIFVEITSPYRSFPLCGFMTSDYSGTIKRSLSKKYLKLPKDNRMTLIIMGYGLGDTKPRKSTMIKALYGIEDEGIEGKYASVPNYFYRQDKNNLSAVGIIDFESDYICEIFHNPYAKRPIPKEIFNKYKNTEQYFNGTDWLKRRPKAKRYNLVKICSTP